MKPHVYFSLPRAWCCHLASGVGGSEGLVDGDFIIKAKRRWHVDLNHSHREVHAQMYICSSN
jgi:Uri superfamily endonuclease